MQSIYQYAWIIPVCPYLAAVILSIGLLLVRNATRSQRLICASISIMMLIFTMVVSIVICWHQILNEFTYSQLWSWITIGTFTLKVGYLIDPLSSIMLILVTTVGLVVMIYTDGYMTHDQGYVRFFAYLSLFTASMLGLVLSPNLVQVYIFWELVGVCSYLLVGFWFARPSAAYACQKAFLTNRIGDFGLLLGILGFYWFTNSFEFNIVAQKTQQLLANDPSTILFAMVCCFLLFLGPVAKSAQFPLHVWLPDAMEGPTPISALIHAATMVAAGVFLTARLLVIFQQVPFVMDTVAWTGGTTAFLGATIALAQRDLKKGLAYSTMSQLGYMILALGIGSYQAGLFHLVTHAYSKALLFLGSGSVIHGMEPVVGYHPERSQDMSYMGGIRSHMPITGVTFFIGTLSLCGIPPFACFWSKDEILADAWSKLPFLGWIAWLTAGLTAFYMFRIYLVTFEGEFRGCWHTTNESNISVTSQNDKNLLLPDTTNHSNSVIHTKPIFPHESTATMVLPLILLTIPVIFIGFIGAPLPYGFPGSSWLSSWLHFDFSPPESLVFNYWIQFGTKAFPSVTITIFGVLIAWFVYGPHVLRLNKNTLAIDPHVNGWVGSVLNSVYNWSLHGAYIDFIYKHTIVYIVQQLAKGLSFFDQWTIDGIVNISGLTILLGGESARYAEGGRTTSYVFLLTTALFLLLVLVILSHLFL